MHSVKRVVRGGNVKSAEPYRRSGIASILSARGTPRWKSPLREFGGVSTQQNCATNHLTGTPDALRLASVRLAIMRHRTNEGENVGADEHTRRCKNLIGDGKTLGIRCQEGAFVRTSALPSRMGRRYGG